MRIGSKTKSLTMTALSAAVVFVVTFAVRIPLPFASGGYLNIGDAPIYLAAYLLGGPCGALAAAVGSALSDVSAGYVAYAVPTFVVKGCMGLVCGALARGHGGGVAARQHLQGFDAKAGAASRSPSGRALLRFVLASALAGAIMVGGYAGFEAVLFNQNQAIASIPFNCVQWAGGVAVAAALFPAVGRLRGL